LRPTHDNDNYYYYLALSRPWDESDLAGLCVWQDRRGFHAEIALAATQGCQPRQRGMTMMMAIVMTMIWRL